MIFLEKIRTVLSAAIMLKDELSPGQIAIGDLFLRLPSGAGNAPRHSTGYFLMVNLPEEPCNVTAGGAFYQENDYTVDPTVLNPKCPLLDLFLEPNAVYPFPEGITILKGKVVDETYKPVSAAHITVKDMTESAVSDERGAFFIRFNVIDSDKSLGMTVQKEGFKIAKVKISLKKGATTVCPEIMLTQK